jgi:hypothetical protein
VAVWEREKPALCYCSRHGSSASTRPVEEGVQVVIPPPPPSRLAEAVQATPEPIIEPPGIIIEPGSPLYLPANLPTISSPSTISAVSSRRIARDVPQPESVLSPSPSSVELPSEESARGADATSPCCTTHQPRSTVFAWSFADSFSSHDITSHRIKPSLGIFQPLSYSRISVGTRNS